MYGDTFGGTMQYLRPKPSRFLVPEEGWIPWNRLCTAKLLGCCS